MVFLVDKGTIQYSNREPSKNVIFIAYTDK